MFMQPKTRNFKDLNNMAVSLFKLLSISSSSTDTFRKKSSEFINLFFIERNVNISESFLFLSEIPVKPNLLSNEISTLLGGDFPTLNQFCKNKEDMIDLLNNALFVTISSSISPVFLTTEQTAEYLSSNKQTIISFIKKNNLPAYKLGNHYRIHLPDVFAFMFSHKVRSSNKIKKINAPATPNNTPNLNKNTTPTNNINNKPKIYSDVKNKPNFNKSSSPTTQTYNQNKTHPTNVSNVKPLNKPIVKDSPNNTPPISTLSPNNNIVKVNKTSSTVDNNSIIKITNPTPIANDIPHDTPFSPNTKGDSVVKKDLNTKESPIINDNLIIKENINTKNDLTINDDTIVEKPSNTNNSLDIKDSSPTIIPSSIPSDISITPISPDLPHFSSDLSDLSPFSRVGEVDEPPTLPYPTMQKTSEQKINNKEKIEDSPPKADSSSIPVIEIKNKFESNQSSDSAETSVEETTRKVIIQKKSLELIGELDNDKKPKVHIPL